MIALVYLGLAICVGERLCGYFFRYVSAAHRWATGTLVGLLLSTCFTYLTGRHFAVATNPLLYGDFLFFACAALFLTKIPPKQGQSMIETSASKSAAADWITLGIFGVLATWMAFATLTFIENRLCIGINQWSDYGPNTAIIQNFAFGHNFPAEYPHYANEPIRYHFLFYFLAGNLEFLGLNLAWSENLISIITLVSLLALVIAFGELLFNSKAVGILAATFFFFHGTLNLVPFLRTQTGGKLSWESVKTAANAIYNLGGYLSSGYPYRGEDWGIWTQVVYINQRHLASSIGIFLVVLIFLFDRYQEKAKQRALARAAARRSRVDLSQPTFERPIASDLPIRHEGERPSDITPDSATPGVSAAGPNELATQRPEPSLDAEVPRSTDLEYHETPSPPAANDAARTEPPAYAGMVPGEQSPLHEAVDVRETDLSTKVESIEESSPTASYAMRDERPAPTAAVPGEPLRSVPEATVVGEAERSGTTDSPLELAHASNDVVTEAIPPTFSSRAYDEYMGRNPDPASVDTVPPTETRESAAAVSQEAVEEKLEETHSLPAPVPEAAATPSRGFVSDIVYDTIVSGKSFIFCGLLLGLLPYWNAPVFTAAGAMLAFLFVLFPYRRYMVALGITAVVIALPQILALRSGNTRSGTALIHWGYTLGAVPVTQVLKYIWWTFGLKWVLILVALLAFSWRNIRLFVAMFSLFLITFCLQFSDENLANHKFLNIWLVLANLFVGYGLWLLWRFRIKGWAIPTRLLAIALAFPIVLGGVIDLFPIHNIGYIQTNYIKDRLIEWIRTETKPGAVFLTDKFVNHPILMAGRKIFFGYTYFTWGAGYDLPKREPQYKLMFESKNAHQVFTLLKANRIDYVAYDDGVRGVFKSHNEKEVYIPNFRKVFEGSDYWNLAIYKVPENPDFLPATVAVAPGSTPVAITGNSVFEGGKGKENGQLDFPRGLVVDSKGNILVADTNNGRLQKFSPTGAFLSVIGKPGSGPGEFRSPGGVTIDASGNLYVADVENHRVQKLKPDGTFISEWKGPNEGFYGPRDITIGPDGSIYVVDEGHARIVRYDPDGRLLAVWGTVGSADGQFGDATSVALDEKAGKVYVADPGNRRIQVFDTYGKFLAKWTVEEWTPTGWHFQDLVVDSQAGRVYASSVGTDEVLAYDLDGHKIQSLRPASPDKLEGCSSLALGKGKLYALNTYGNRLSWIDIQAK